MKILVTGGAGYVGSHLCKLLRTQNIAHLVYDNFSTGHKKHLKTSPFIEGDITDWTALQNCMADFLPDAVIHLAAIATIPDCTANPERATLVNSEGTRILLDVMRRHGVRAVAFASSCGVYAATPTPRPFNERDQLDPPSLYGQTKLESERLLRHYYDEYGIGFAALRIFNVCGADPDGEIGEEHGPETHLIPLVIKAALTGEPLSLFGNDYDTIDGTAVRDYIHVMDVAETALRSAQHLVSKRDKVILNTGSGTPYSVLQVVQAVEAIAKKKVPIIYTPRREGDAPYLLGDISALKARFHDVPRRSDLTTIVESAYAWHAGHRD